VVPVILWQKAGGRGGVALRPVKVYDRVEVIRLPDLGIDLLACGLVDGARMIEVRSRIRRDCPTDHEDPMGVRALNHLLVAALQRGDQGAVLFGGGNRLLAGKRPSRLRPQAIAKCSHRSARAHRDRSEPAHSDRVHP
jgi:hypothetical protein